MAKQRVLRAFESRLGNLKVVVARHTPHQLAQTQIGAALGFQQGLELAL